MYCFQIRNWLEGQEKWPSNTGALTRLKGSTRKFMPETAFVEVVNNKQGSHIKRNAGDLQPGKRSVISRSQSHRECKKYGKEKAKDQEWVALKRHDQHCKSDSQQDINAKTKHKEIFQCRKQHH